MDLGDVPEADDLLIHLTRPRPDLVRILVAGELDGVTAPRLAAALETELAGERRAVVTLELGGVTFCSVAGITVVLRARGRAAEAGHTVVVERFSAAVNRVVRICGLGAVLVEEDPPSGP